MRSHRLTLVVVGLSLALAGCPRYVGDPDSGSPSVDSGYDPGPGNSFEGPIVLDDERVRAVDPSTLPSGETPCREPVLARVYAVTDGDTLRVRSEDGLIDAPVRMIGIDTPEIGHGGDPSECYGEEAAQFTEQLDEHLVWLTFDSTCFDTFNRLLAYVHVGGGTGDLWERQLLRRGLANVLTVGDNRSFERTFELDESQAATADVGLWSACF